MKAGNMIHVLHVERGSNSVNAAGTPVFTWNRIATLRGEVVERSTEEFLRRSGETDETTIVFRTRLYRHLRHDDRIAFDGDVFDIEEIISIGRRTGLEIRCVASGDAP
ncbi:phage head closure protein [Palleronia sp. LCG004]|uniref:phage head closure protein n=1 Tax=Palleronia sp. LCG004 TaxID=3079304 RepID=UPI002942A648|nr:phage head closure protein [Palleronia sp. LCG004]WOI55126.1 phage head closure protein [Palleronia sp. LCG004]